MLHEDRLHGTLQVTDLHGTHGRLDTRTSRHAALVNRESSYGLSPAEMVASSSGWGIGRMGERQDWPIAALFFDRQSRRGRLGHKMLAIAWPTALGEEMEKARGGALFWCPRACNNGMAVVSRRGQSSCSVCLQAGLYNPSVLPALKTQLKKSAFLQRSQDVPLCPHPILSQWLLLT